MVDTSQYKEQRNALRTHMRAERKALSQEQLHTAEQGLLQQCKPLLRHASSVAGYKAINGEISVNALFNYCSNNNCTTLLPIMRGELLSFAPFDKNTQFITHAFGVEEPNIASEQYWAPMDINVVLVPLVAFDAQCNRIGMGGGFYDKSFANRQQQAAPPLLIGVAHSLQQTEKIPTDWWDVPLDYIATDKNLFKRSDSLQG